MRYHLYLNCKIVKDAQRLSTITKYYNVYCKLYNREDNCISVYDSEKGEYILDNN